MFNALFLFVRNGGHTNNWFISSQIYCIIKLPELALIISLEKCMVDINTKNNKMGRSQNKACIEKSICFLSGTHLRTQTLIQIVGPLVIVLDLEP